MRFYVRTCMTILALGGYLVLWNVAADWLSAADSLLVALGWVLATMLFALPVAALKLAWPHLAVLFHEVWK